MNVPATSAVESRQAVIDSEFEKSIRTIFERLDQEKRGYLDSTQLSKTVQQVSSFYPTSHIKDLIQICDSNNDGRVDFSEFLAFFIAKEDHLKQAFREIDTNPDGLLDEQELRQALQKAGIELSKTKLRQFVKRMDKNNDGLISYDEWRTFLLLFPYDTSLKSIYHYYELSFPFDTGDQMFVPVSVAKPIELLLAGGMAGAVSRTVTAPLDRVKVILQNSSKPPGLWALVTQIYRQEGTTGFFRGNGLNLLKIFPESAIRLCAFDMWKRFLTSSNDGPTTTERFVAGGLAGLTSQVSVYPLELLKTKRMLASPDSQLNVVGLARRTYQLSGFRGFYAGFSPAVIGIVPYSAIDLTIFESLKFFYTQTYHEVPGVVGLLCSGAVSSTIGAMSVYPLAVLRTRYLSSLCGFGHAC